MKDRIIFRYWPEAQDVIAFMPDSDANPGRVLSYEHIGQHGEADYHMLLRVTRPATPTEYADLLAELVGRGYDPIICKRLSRGGNKT